MSDWDASRLRGLLSASESEAAEEGPQVDIDSVAVEDVVAVQNVLGESPISFNTSSMYNGLLTIKPELLQIYLSLSAAPPQSDFHLLPSCCNLMGAPLLEADAPAGAAAALATVAAMRKILMFMMASYLLAARLLLDTP